MAVLRKTSLNKLIVRKINNQPFCSTYLGCKANNPNYSFPFYHDLLELKAPENWRPEAEIIAARNK